MTCLLIYLLLILLSTKGIDSNLKLTGGYNILTYEGGSFYQRILEEDTNISKCSASFKDLESEDTITIELDINSNKATFPEDFEDTNDLKNRLHSLGSGLCGFQLDEVTLEDPTDWSMEAIFNGKQNVASFSVGIYETRDLSTTKQTPLGSELSIVCNSDSVLSKPIYCHLYDPKGNLINKANEGCSYSTKSTNKDDYGDWKCLFGGTPYTKPLNYTISVITKDPLQRDFWIVEKEDFISIGCILKDVPSQNYCIMTSPMGEKLIIKEGSAFKRYSSVYTNLEKNICALEIKKPLLQSDKGAWTCEMSNNGMFIQVGDEKISNRESFNSIIVTEMGRNFQINCKVFYSASNCFITSPTGERYQQQYASRSQLGECSLNVQSAKEEHNGTWSCTFIKDGDVVADQQKYEVLVKYSLSCSVRASTTNGNDAIMSCTSPKSPLEYCWFTSPSGKTYQLTNKVDTSEVLYVGDGLQFGDCGIKIRNVKEEDVGNWTCSVKLGSVEKVQRINLDLKPGGTVSLAAALSAGIGSIVILLVALGGLLYKKYKRPNTETIRDSSSDTSSDIIYLTETSGLQENSANQRQYTF